MKVTYLSHHGDDLLVVNSARVSLGKHKQEMDESDVRLLRHLAAHRPIHWCYDDQTEILTNTGWVPFKCLDINHTVAQVYGWEDGKALMSLVKPTAVHVSSFKGYMICAETGTANYCVTPNHNMLAQKRGAHGYRSDIVESAERLFGVGKRMRTTASLVQEGQGSFIEGQYIGFLLGDGYRISSNKVGVRLKLPRKIIYLRGLLLALNIEYREIVQKDGVTYFDIQDAETRLDKCQDKRIPDPVGKSHQFLQGLFAGLMESDGSVKHQGWVYSTSSPMLAGDVKHLATLCGYAVSETRRRHLDNPNHNVNYLITILSRDWCAINVSRRDEFLREYDGEVYCVTVPSGMVMTRRNGKQLVCGNSPFSHPQLTVRVEAPIFVARQLLRHQVGLAVNEVSRRYVDHPPEFYRPKQWRRRPDHGIKQGSGSAMSASEQSTLADIYDDLLIELQSAYKLMIGLGVAPEQARMLLPQSMYTSWYWTGSLYAFHRVVAHRLPSDAQFETREIAEQLHDILRDCFPQAYGALYQYAGDGC